MTTKTDFPTSHYATTTEIASHLGRTKKTVRKHMRYRLVPFETTPSGQWRIERTVAERFIKDEQAGAPLPEGAPKLPKTGRPRIHPKRPKYKHRGNQSKAEREEMRLLIEQLEREEAQAQNAA